MKDAADNKTLDLLEHAGIAAPKRRRGLPQGTSGALDAAERKRRQRERQAGRVYSHDTDELTDAECLAILSGKRWRAGPIDQGAWRRLGALRGFTP